MGGFVVVLNFTLNILLIGFFGLSAVANSEVQHLMRSYTIAAADTHLMQLKEAEIEKTPYSVQIASYMNETDAVSHVNEIKNKEAAVFYYPSFVRGQVWFKVYVGKFENKLQAEEYRKQFIKKFDEPFAVVVSMLDRPTRDERLPASENKKSNSGQVVGSPAKSVNKPKIEGFEKTKKDLVAVLSAKPATEAYFSVQIGAYPSADLAQAEVQKLLGQGHKAFIETAAVKGKTWHRVFVGNFDTKEAAEQHRLNLLSKTGHKDSFIRRMPTGK